MRCGTAGRQVGRGMGVGQDGRLFRERLPTHGWCSKLGTAYRAALQTAYRAALQTL